MKNQESSRTFITTLLIVNTIVTYMGLVTAFEYPLNGKIQSRYELAPNLREQVRELVTMQ